MTEFTTEPFRPTARQHDAVMGVLYRRLHLRDDALVRDIFDAIAAHPRVTGVVDAKPAVPAALRWPA